MSDLISRWYAPGTAGESKRIYDSDEIMVDYRDGMLRISQFADGHWVDEHFVELPEEVKPVTRKRRATVCAHWIYEEVECQDLGKPTLRHYRRCSACGKRFPRSPGSRVGINLCPTCGAHMDEEVAE